MTLRLCPCLRVHEFKRKNVLHVANLSWENWERWLFWTQNMLFMVFLCRWHLILDIQLQYQMLTMMGKFIRTSLTEYYSHPLKMLYFFFMTYILLYFLNKIEALLFCFFVFFFSSGQEDITTEELYHPFNVFATSALLRKHYFT